MADTYKKGAIDEEMRKKYRAGLSQQLAGGLPAKPPTGSGMVAPPPPAPPTGAVLGMYPQATAGGVIPDVLNQPVGYMSDSSPSLMADSARDAAPGAGIPPLSDLMTQANGVYDQIPEYGKAGKLYDELNANRNKSTEYSHRLTEAALKLGVDPEHPAESLGNLVNEATGTMPSGHGLLGLLSMAQNYRASKQTAKRQAMDVGIKSLKFLKDLHDSGDKDSMELAGQYLKQGQERKDLLKEASMNARSGAQNDRLNNSQDERARHNLIVESIRQQALDNKIPLTEAQIQSLAASAGLRDAQAQTVRAQLPYAGPQAQAKVSLTQNLGNAVAPRTAVAGMAATGQRATPEMMQQIGLEGGAPPGEPVIPQTATTQALPPLTPKAQDAHEKNAATIANSNARTEEIVTHTGLELTALKKKAENQYKALTGAGVSGANFWQKNKAAWNLLSDEQKHQILQLHAQGK